MSAGVPSPRASSSRNELFLQPATSASPSVLGSPRTSSFFDVSSSLESPSPAPRLASRHTPSFSPSPLSLSRASSLRNRPPPISTGYQTGTPDNDRLSPLHQSPSLLPNSGPLTEWRPPLPPSSDDISLRFTPTSTYLLGEGRYAQVFLASYRQSGRQCRTAGNDKRINTEGDGLAGGSWRLCAAKRMAPDRESQTMGLREAFFLNRLTKTSRARSPSPLRYDLEHARRPNGSVYIVRLIAVKEDVEPRRNIHNRSTSDAITEGIRSKATTRQRSSTFGLPSTEESPLASSPSLPTLGQTARGTPAVSRLVLLLEHAPLGTMDRLLRTSPGIVSRQMWERWAGECLDALAWVHEKGVVHADVKPGNLLLTADLHLRLSDFGSSLLIHPAHPPTDGVGLGTLPFSPPELVDPLRSFSFPVDIFALGATLYQCISGREPFKGMRAVEMMHHVRKGGLWAWEERCRLGRIGEDPPHHSSAGSPYPSAWRDQSVDGLKRGGSLRMRTGQQDRPALSRMSSAESLRASNDLVHGRNGVDSPAGVKLWAKWVKQLPSQTSEPIAALLMETDEPGGDCQADISNSIPSGHSSSEQYPPSNQSLSDEPDVPTTQRSLPPPYDDGSPAMIFLDGQEVLSGPIRDVLKAMVDPDPGERPSAEELRVIWSDFILRTESML